MAVRRGSAIPRARSNLGRVSDGDLRIQLEGRAELLEATLLRYRALASALEAFRWRDRLRRVAPVLREVARVEQEVSDALPVVRRRLASEEAPGSSPLRACVEEVAALNERLLALTQKRLGEAAGRSNLAARLLVLEEKVVNEPRLVLPQNRMAAAVQVLPTSLPELARVRAFGAAVEHLFARPISPQHVLPFSRDEWDALENEWLEGLEALSDAWQRVVHIDLTNGVARALRRLAKRAPLKKPETGPELLVHAEFWKNLALAQIDQVVRARISPAEPGEDERFALFRYLLSRERDAEARLVDEGLALARAAIIELAHELSGIPAERARAQGSWDPILSRAEKADANPKDADWARLRDTLRMLWRVMSQPSGRALPPLYRAQGMKAVPSSPTGAPATLAALVRAMRESAIPLPGERRADPAARRGTS